MILHTINKSPYRDNSFIECLRFIGGQASVLLIEDGVYAAQDNTSFSLVLDTLDPEILCYALAADIDARGLNNTLIKRVTLINDSEFVELVATHHAVQSWF
ncbi:MAG: sulfurtransferase complex subunit TusB [Oceanicoccus sp.]